MKSKNPEIKIQQAESDQAKQAVPLFYETDPLLFDYLYIDGYETALMFFEKEWRKKQSVYSYSHCSVAMSEGTLLGIELGYDRKTLQEQAHHTGKNGIDCLSPEGKKQLAQRNRYLRYLFPSIPYDAYFILFLATHHTARGLGCGRKLLVNAFDRARRQGYRTCVLDVASENKAVGFYLEMGMEILSESRVVPLEENGIPSHYHMIKKL